MFPSLATRETYVAKTSFASRKQTMFLPQVKNIFASRTQILLPKHMLLSLATTDAMQTSFQCCSLKMFPIFYYYAVVPRTLFPSLATQAAKHFLET